MGHAQSTERISHESFAAWLKPRGATVEERSGAALHLVPEVDHLLCSRATLWSACASEPDAAVHWTVEQFRAAGVSRYFVQYRAEAHGAATEAALQAQGLRPYHRNWVHLERDASEPSAVDLRGLSIAPARMEHAREVARLLGDAFDLPAEATPLCEGLVTDGVWQVLVALEGKQPVAVGGLYVSDGIGYLGFAATSAEHRGRGAQKALIAARIERARELGCTRLVSETGEAVAGQRNTSCLNLEAAGFVPSHVLRNFTRPGVTW